MKANDKFQSDKLLYPKIEIMYKKLCLEVFEYLNRFLLEITLTDKEKRAPEHWSLTLDYCSG